MSLDTRDYKNGALGLGSLKFSIKGIFNSLYLELISCNSISFCYFYAYSRLRKDGFLWIWPYCEFWWTSYLFWRRLSFSGRASSRALPSLLNMWDYFGFLAFYISYCYWCYCSSFYFRLSSYLINLAANFLLIASLADSSYSFASLRILSTITW